MHLTTPILLRGPGTGLVLMTLVALAGPGCQSKKNLDKNVDRLVKAARSNDYAAFEKMSRPELVEKFPRSRFKMLAKALSELGSFEERTMQGIEVKAGGIRKGKYSLRFAKGKVKLELTLAKGKLVAFMFSGEDLREAMRKVNRERYAELKVGRFQWTDAQGEPRPGDQHRLGQPIKFKMEVWGLKKAGNKLNVKVDLQLVRGEQVLINRPGFVDKPIEIPASMPPVATVTGNLKVPQPGAYTLRMRILDRIAQKSLIHTQLFEVKPAPGAARRPAERAAERPAARR
jgi:hypothetical protein